MDYANEVQIWLEQYGAKLLTSAPIRPSQKIDVRCQCGNIFKRAACEFRERRGTCSDCSKRTSVGKIRKSTEQFVAEAESIYGSVYEYSKMGYVNNRTHITLTCKLHVITFQVTPTQHLKGMSGCSACATCKRRETAMKTKEYFIEKALLRYDKYDYSKLPEKFLLDTYVTIICPEHGDFRCNASKHLLGKKHCGKCVKDVALKKVVEKSKQLFIDKAKLLNGNKYDYSQIEYVNLTVPVMITCQYGHKFSQAPDVHLKGGACKKCSNCGFSKKSCKWLDSIAQQRGILIQHALNIGEKRIPIHIQPHDMQGVFMNRKTVRVDGFCEETNTAFEFHGCWWHGHPKCHDAAKINTVSDKTMGQLYEETLKKERLIRDEGYNLEVIWECEYTDI